MARQDTHLSRSHPLHSRRRVKFVYSFHSYQSLRFLLVDTAVPESFSQLFESLTIMIIRFIGIMYFAPIFGVIGLFLLLTGTLIGDIYMKTQLSVKREMSKAKAPVLSHFGAAVEGLRESS